MAQATRRAAGTIRFLGFLALTAAALAVLPGTATAQTCTPSPTNILVNGGFELPFAVPIVHEREAASLCLDAILLDPREIAPLFAFNRAYMMVDMEVPSAYDLSQAKAAYLNGFLRIDVPLAQRLTQNTKVLVADGN